MNTRVHEAGRRAGLHKQTFEALDMRRERDGVWRVKPKPQITTKRVVSGVLKLAVAAWLASVFGGS